MNLTLALFLLVILFSHFCEGVTGTGSVSLSLPFAIMLIGAQDAIPVLMTTAVIYDVGILVVERKNIDYKQVKIIFLHMIAGLPAGFICYRLFAAHSPNYLKIPLCIFMLFVSAQNIYVLLIKPLLIKYAEAEHPRQKPEGVDEADESHSFPMWFKKFLLIVAGLFFGALGTAGAFVTVYATGAIRDKSKYRGTLSLLWVFLGGVMVAQYLFTNVYTAEVVYYIGISMPVIAIGFVLGNIVHRMVSLRLFFLLIYIIMFISGLFLFVEMFF